MIPPRNAGYLQKFPQGHHRMGPALPGLPGGHRSMREDWKNWLEVTIKLFGLPSSTTTYEIYELFRSEGTVVKVELSENNNARRDGSGSVTFSPPPVRAFWEEQYWETSRGSSRNISLRMELGLPRRTFTHPSPVDQNKRYPEIMVLSARSLEFGFMQQPNDMMSMETIRSLEKERIKFKLNLLRREILINFPLSIPGQKTKNNQAKYEKLKFAIPMKTLHFIWELEPNKEERSLIISLDKPPAFFTQLENVQDTHDEGRIWTDNCTWTRRTEISHASSKHIEEPLTLPPKDCFIDIGRWTTYKLNFDGNSVDRRLYDNLCQALRDYNISVFRPEKFELSPRSDISVWDLLYTPDTQKTHDVELFGLNDQAYLPWPVRYQLESCISHGWIKECNITKEFLKRLTEIPEREATLALEAAADKQQRFFNPMNILDVAVPRDLRRRKVPRHCVVQRSATITPTTIYYSTPAVEMSNRILRKYAQHADRFLRVRFTDEKHEGRIHSASDNSKTAIFNRIYRCLVFGIQIGDVRFEFLAAGNSQFREHGAYFFASLPYLNVESIRKEMGRFDDIKVVAKYASRLGLCFSTTHAVRNMGTIRPKEFPDVQRYGYNFTDGVGKMSKDFATFIASELGLPHPKQFPPSAYQFRMGGSKGIVAIDPALKGFHEIHIRESQYKFAASYQGFEIIRWSSYSVPRLNRQLITILKCLNVPDEVFCTKMRNELMKLDRAMVDEELALQMLQHQIDFNQMSLEIASIVHDGFLEVQDPFALSVLHLWRSWSLKQLKEKAGLVVQQGAFLLGCTDETASLVGWFHNSQPGPEEPYEKKVEALPQVFVQITDLENKGSYVVIEGVCLVARNPSLHPGDVRVVRAVNLPQLHHLRDVVVFPQLGHRDIPGMCSGGDLDGDDFVVIWDKDMIPPTEKWDVPAMNFEGPTPEKVDEVSIEDIAKFFVHYMQHDTLRTIARFHLANADYLSDGVENPRCLELARQHSIAVDFPKSGQAPDPPSALKPQKWPHFMTNEFRAKDKEYHSNTVLGQLFDMVPDYNFRPLLDRPFDQRIIKAHYHSDQQLAMVEDIKSEYDTAVRRIMAQHEIKTEFEIWSTFVMNHSKLEGDYKFHEEIGRISTTLKEQYSEMIYDRAGGRDFETLAPWISAMYVVTTRQAERAIEELKHVHLHQTNSTESVLIDSKVLPLISFPWLFHRELGKIVRGQKAPLILDIPAIKVAPRQKVKVPVDIMDQPIDDMVETAEGVVHRGEELQLFQDKTNIQRPLERMKEDQQRQESANQTQTGHSEDRDVKPFKGDMTHATMIEDSTTEPAEIDVYRSVLKCRNIITKGYQLGTWAQVENEDGDRPDSVPDSTYSSPSNRSPKQRIVGNLLQEVNVKSELDILANDEASWCKRSDPLLSSAGLRDELSDLLQGLSLEDFAHQEEVLAELGNRRNMEPFQLEKETRGRSMDEPGEETAAVSSAVGGTKPPTKPMADAPPLFPDLQPNSLGRGVERQATSPASNTEALPLIQFDQDLGAENTTRHTSAMTELLALDLFDGPRITKEIPDSGVVGESSLTAPEVCSADSAMSSNRSPSLRPPARIDNLEGREVEEEQEGEIGDYPEQVVIDLSGPSAFDRARAMGY